MAEPTYATPEEMRVQFDKVDPSKDESVLKPLLSGAERVINRVCNRPDGFISDSAASARIYPGTGKTFQYIDECTSITTVAVKESPTDTSYTAWTSADWIAARGSPSYPNYNETPYDLLIVDPTGDQEIFFSGTYSSWAHGNPATVNKGVPMVQITAKWGYATVVPDDIKDACIMQAIRWYKRLEGGMSDALANAELGMLLYRQTIDPEVKLILMQGRYVKPSVGRR